MSFQISIDPVRREGARAISYVRDELLKVALAERRSSGITASKIAEGLGVHRSVVSRELAGHANLTIRRLGELAYLLGRGFEVRFPKLAEPGHNDTAVGLPQQETSKPQTKNALVNDMWAISGVAATSANTVSSIGNYDLIP